VTNGELVLPAGASAAGGPRHFYFIDALRGYAILAVILFHTNQFIPNSYPPLHRIASFGGSGVELFFVISAFTLFWSLRNRQSSDRRPLPAFFARRLFRVAPAFWVAILFYLGHPDFWRDQFAPDGVGVPQILTTIFFVHGWYPTTINSVVPGGWSIAAEMMFYLTVPLLFRYIRTFRAALILAVCSSILAAIGRPIAVHLISPHFPSAWGGLIQLFVGFTFPSQFPCFCWGIVLYHVQVDERQTDWRRLTLVLACVAALFLGPADLFLAAASMVVAWLLAMRPLSVFTGRIVRYIGLVSYSAYLWHFCILDRLAVFVLPAMRTASHDPHTLGTLRLVALYSVVVVVTVLVASLSYFVIERPFMNLGGWLIRRLGWGRIVVNP
jgi:peptidoglycan/LPS O-acetylase OafA/YrhL